MAQEQESLLHPYQAMLEYGIHQRDLERYHELHQQLLEHFHQKLSHPTYVHELMFAPIHLLEVVRIHHHDA
ncbi:hypothetical protein D3C79_959740 [compost metagenome]